MDILEGLTNEQLLAEVGYLRLTTAPGIMQMRRVKDDGKLKMVKFSESELRTSIRNALKPEEDLQEDIVALLNDALND